MNEVFHSRVSNEGRVAIPAVCRKQIGLQAGQEVIIKVTADGLLLTSYDQALDQFQDEVSKLVGPGVSLVDEVIADRRAEAAKEVSE